MRTISIPALRRLVISAQGYVPRARRAGADDVEGAIRRAMCIQLDTVTAVERSHRIAIATRAGIYPRDTVPGLLREGRVIENWTHALSLVPADDWPLYDWARQRMRDGAPWHGDVRSRYPGLAERVLDEIRERGPLGSKDFAGKADPAPHRVGTSSEVMWSWKPAKQMLDALFASGELVIAGRLNFNRLYDIPERVLPREVLNAPIPPEEEAVQALIGKAVRARGALREFAIAEHVRPIWGFLGGAKAARPYVDSLVADGKLERVAVEDGGEPVVVEAEAELDRPRPGTAALLSPFDNLLWEFHSVRRVLGYEHVIELYKPAPQRRYGYYVLPFLWRDRIVGRADLKSERRDGALVVKAFHLEPGVRRSNALDDAFDRALDRLRRTVGLERVVR
ncbi:MAG TPA: crosslink repair DNA glycosylase YcaQ family protein [Gaiellaceae bacterium]|nr:crosslink repair DNA glycosylase YcaQ family protein [Gaiellaceae bacterium]